MLTSLAAQPPGLLARLACMPAWLGKCTPCTFMMNDGELMSVELCSSIQKAQGSQRTPLCGTFYVTVHIYAKHDA
jgi:hypothetical protein